MNDGKQILSFTYTNHRCETARRRVKPIGLWYGESPAWYDGEHWFLDAYCLDRNEMRTFRIDGMKDITEE